MADYDPVHVQYLHLGLEGQRCKVYWEFPMPERLDGSTSHHVQYRAWKWHAGEPAAACSDYVILPSAGAARAAIRQTTQAMPALVGELIEQLEISAALKHYPWPPMTVAIDEWLARQSTPRRSLNVHLHEADLPLGTIAGLMMALAREWQAAPQQTLVDWVARHGAERLSNVSLGLGHDSQPFFTCYYGGRVLSPDSKADESGQAQQP
ncbi:hypothetical protein SAMN05192555_1019 [Franzmannia pantelleriensis]|uniref:Uncharacterized protein n=2 Tax=Franzmannia pantelleriensis TaxID=48727 RepID=A0A1G9E6I0_9GAMM|nr:hypothetical protein SAMN05192555_1019 [Halomonas pantelleriensis]